MSGTLTGRVYRPTSLEEVFEALKAVPDAHLLAGGTDFMVEVNYGHRRPPAVISLRDVPELRAWRREGSELVLGAGFTYTSMMKAEIADLVPALAQAARTVGSPQIRNAGTLAGNIATASPAGDTLPVLAALDASIVVANGNTNRTVGLDELIVGPKRTTLEPGELIVEVRLPALAGTQEFLKVGTRNAMVISVAGVAVVADWLGRSVRIALGSVGPVIIRARAAEAFCAQRIDWETRTLDGGEETLAELGRLTSAAARPIDDHRSTADYRRHAVGVCARRAVERVLRSAAAAREEGLGWTL
jgi:CO/xanthine dehydrogenase FAD-binding subunit